MGVFCILRVGIGALEYSYSYGTPTYLGTSRTSSIIPLLHSGLCNTMFLWGGLCKLLPLMFDIWSQPLPSALPCSGELYQLPFPTQYQVPLF